MPRLWFCAVTSFSAGVIAAAVAYDAYVDPVARRNQALRAKIKRCRRSVEILEERNGVYQDALLRKERARPATGWLPRCLRA